MINEIIVFKSVYKLLEKKECWLKIIYLKYFRLDIFLLLCVWGGWKIYIYIIIYFKDGKNYNYKNL